MRPELAACLTLGLLAGCSSLPAARSAPPQAPPVTETVQSLQLTSLLASLLKVVNGTPAEQAEEIAVARARFEDARQGGPAVLRYGLLLAAPGHPARDATQAQQLLREALAQPQLLSTNERTLAMVELERVSIELRMAAEHQRIVLELQQERERQRGGATSAALTRQLQAANEQIAQLRKDLAEARDKLNAIAELERRQADRPPAGESRNP